MKYIELYDYEIKLLKHSQSIIFKFLANFKIF
jgi:hypothetical protein